MQPTPGPPEPWPRERRYLERLFLCTRTSIEKSSRGAPLLSATLRDRGLVVSARTTIGVARLAKTFAAGDVVRARGLTNWADGRPQLMLSHVSPVPHACAEDWLPDSRRCVRELEDIFDYFAGEIADAPLRRLVLAAFADDRLRVGWTCAPASLTAHYAWRGGLLEHTVAVAHIVCEEASLHPALDASLALAAALLHELGAVLRAVGHRLSVRAYLERAGLRRHALAACIEAPAAADPPREPEAAVVWGADRLDTAVAAAKARFGAGASAAWRLR